MEKPKFQDGGVIPNKETQEPLLRGEKLYELVDACNFYKVNSGRICTNCHLEQVCNENLQDMCGDNDVFRRII